MKLISPLFWLDFAHFAGSQTYLSQATGPGPAVSGKSSDLGRLGARRRGRKRVEKVRARKQISAFSYVNQIKDLAKIISRFLFPRSLRPPYQPSPAFLPISKEVARSTYPARRDLQSPSQKDDTISFSSLSNELPSPSNSLRGAPGNWPRSISEQCQGQKGGISRAECS